MTSIKLFIVAIISFSITCSCSAKDNETKIHTFGESNKAKDKILIVYGSKAGSTAEVADSIGKTLALQGENVDVTSIGDINSIAAYKTVIIGSAIRMGQVLPEVSDFIKNNKTILEQKNTVYFIVCMTLIEDNPENRTTVNAYLDPQRIEVKPITVGLFAGKMDYSKLGFFSRIIAKRFAKVPEGDYRNWKEIKQWTVDLQKQLSSK